MTIGIKMPDHSSGYIQLISECPVGIRGAFSETVGVYRPYNEITDR